MVQDLTGQVSTLQSQNSVLQSQVVTLRDQLKTPQARMDLLQNDISALKDRLGVHDQSLPSFVNFLQLPVELRLQIWRNYPDPRVFKIQDFEEGVHWCECQLNRKKLPSIFADNQESRNEAQRLYTKWKHSDMVDWGVHFRTKDSYIYFNGHIDTLVITRDFFDSGLEKLCAELSVKHLASTICESDYIEDKSMFYSLWNTLASFTFVKEVFPGGKQPIELVDDDDYTDLQCFFSPPWLHRLCNWYFREDNDEEEEIDEEFVLEPEFGLGWDEALKFLEYEMATERKERNEPEKGRGAELLAKVAVLNASHCPCPPCTVCDLKHI